MSQQEETKEALVQAQDRLQKMHRKECSICGWFWKPDADPTIWFGLSVATVFSFILEAVVWYFPPDLTGICLRILAQFVSLYVVYWWIDRTGVYRRFCKKGTAIQRCLEPMHGLDKLRKTINRQLVRLIGSRSDLGRALAETRNQLTDASALLDVYVKRFGPMWAESVPAEFRQAYREANASHDVLLARKSALEKEVRVISDRFQALANEVDRVEAKAVDRVILALPSMAPANGRLTADSVRQLSSMNAQDEERIEDLKRRVTDAIRESGVQSAIAAESTIGDPNAMDAPMEQVAAAEIRVEKA